MSTYVCVCLVQMMDEEATKRYCRTSDDGQKQTQAEVPSVHINSLPQNLTILLKHDNLIHF